MLMTQEVLKNICKEHGLYRTPALNDKLYLNFKGFSSIANLNEYTALKALFLEGNALDSLEGLPALPELRCLYAQQNILLHVSGLTGVPELDTLNVSNNRISTINAIHPHCPKLSTLIATHNQLDTLESVIHLASCKSLHTLDLQSNLLSDPAILDSVLTQLPSLTCLYLKGNPVVSAIKNYRKTLIASIPTLAYLDDRPVFEAERRAVDAWAKGGLDAERDERKRIKEEEAARDRINFDFMVALRKEGHQKRRALLGLPEGDTDPALEDFSDGEYEFLEEPAELVAARDRLAAYTARMGEEEPAELTQARRERVCNGRQVREGCWSDAARDQNEQCPPPQHVGKVPHSSVGHAAKELLNLKKGCLGGGAGPAQQGTTDTAALLDNCGQTFSIAAASTAAVPPLGASIGLERATRVFVTEVLDDEVAPSGASVSDEAATEGYAEHAGGLVATHNLCQTEVLEVLNVAERAERAWASASVHGSKGVDLVGPIGGIDIVGQGEEVCAAGCKTSVVRDAWGAAVGVAGELDFEELD